MKSLMSSLLLILLFTSNARAQNVVQWDQAGISLSIISQYSYKLYVTPSGQSNPTTTATLSTVSCSGQASPFNCSAPLPTGASNAVQPGAKSELTSTDPMSGLESPKSIPFIKPVAPVAPTNLRITP